MTMRNFLLFFVLLVMSGSVYSQSMYEIHDYVEVVRTTDTTGELPIIYLIPIRQNIGSHTWLHLRNGLHEARELNADAVILHMNTYGGAVVEADSMRTAILNFPLPIYVFIDNNAISAGALISIATDSIFMRNSALMGAATVVMGPGGDAAAEKMQSAMRAMMRATAESHGKIERVDENGDTIQVWRRDPTVAEAMVDERVIVPGFAEEDKLLTVTASEAMQLGFADAIVENLHELITEHLGFSDYILITFEPTLYDRIRGFLMSGVVQAFLIMLIVGGIWMEIRSPGVGLPTAVAITAAILYFTPLYLTGYAQQWEILLFVFGLILIVFEIFVFPGFGIPGIVGILAVFVALILALVDNVVFNFSDVPFEAMLRAVIIVIVGVVSGTALLIFSSSRIGKPGLFRRVALAADQEGFVSVSLEPANFIGQTGVTATALRPAGKVLIEGTLHEAVSMKGFMEKGEEVVVRKYENFQLYVTKIISNQ